MIKIDSGIKSDYWQSRIKLWKARKGIRGSKRSAENEFKLIVS